MEDEFRRAISAERARQTLIGYDHNHDRTHGIEHLLVWAQEYAANGKPVQSAAIIQAARERITELRNYVDDPGNWSALDGRRGALLNLLGEPS